MWSSDLIRKEPVQLHLAPDLMHQSLSALTRKNPVQLQVQSTDQEGYFTCPQGESVVGVNFASRDIDCAAPIDGRCEKERHSQLCGTIKDEKACNNSRRKIGSEWVPCAWGRGRASQKCYQKSKEKFKFKCAD